MHHISIQFPSLKSCFINAMMASVSFDPRLQPWSNIGDHVLLLIVIRSLLPCLFLHVHGLIFQSSQFTVQQTSRREQPHSLILTLRTLHLCHHHPLYVLLPGFLATSLSVSCGDDYSCLTGRSKISIYLQHTVVSRAQHQTNINYMECNNFSTSLLQIRGRGCRCPCNNTLASSHKGMSLNLRVAEGKHRICRALWDTIDTFKLYDAF